MKVAYCTCGTGILLAHDEGGNVLRAEAKEVSGGPYKIEGGTLRKRMTRGGKPCVGGIGLRIHSCPREAEPAHPLTPGAIRRTCGGCGHDFEGAPTAEGARCPRCNPAARSRAPQRRPKVDPTDGYVDCTGARLGRAQCHECACEIIVAAHHLRPDGENPVLLASTGPLDTRPWRVYAKIDTPDTPLAMYLGDQDHRATMRNHRIDCPKARPVDE